MNFMPTITIPKKTIKKSGPRIYRDLNAWRALRGIWRDKKMEDPVRWQRRIRGEEMIQVSRYEYEELVRIAKIIPKDQEWFWTKEWQEKERQADADIKARRLSGPYQTRGDLSAALKKLKLR